MEWIKNFLISSIYVLIFMKIVYMVFPDNKLNPYAKFVMGIMAMIVIMTPVINGFTQGIAIPDIDKYYGSLDTHEIDTSKIDKIQENQIIKIYEERIEENIKDNVSSRFGVDLVNVDCECDREGEKGKILKLNIEVVSIDENLKRDVTNYIKSTYDVENDVINWSM